MATWQADIKVTQTGNYFPVTVEAGASYVAKETIQHIYNPITIRNLHQVRSGGGGGSLPIPSGGGTLLVGLFAGAGLLLYFTPWVLMTVYGAAGTWLSQKIVGVTVSDFADNDNPTDEEVKRGMIILASALILGGAGFIHGTLWNKELNVEYNLDGKQSKVQEVIKK